MMMMMLLLFVCFIVYFVVVVFFFSFFFRFFFFFFFFFFSSLYRSAGKEGEQIIFFQSRPFFRRMQKNDRIVSLESVSIPFHV